MSILPLIIAPDPRLKQISQPVVQIDDEIRTMLANMVETMHANDGGGLAAPQVGILKRMIIVTDPDTAQREESLLYKMINPEILWTSEEVDAYDEGCLSIPEERIRVTRPARVKVRYWDEYNQKCELEASGYFGKCIQHEVDHLNGILTYDYYSSLRKSLVVKRLTKIKRHYTQVTTPSLVETIV